MKGLSVREVSTGSTDLKKDQYEGMITIVLFLKEVVIPGLDMNRNHQIYSFTFCKVLTGFFNSLNFLLYYQKDDFVMSLLRVATSLLNASDPHVVIIIEEFWRRWFVYLFFKTKMFDSNSLDFFVQLGDEVDWASHKDCQGTIRQVPAEIT
jgi:hypothetical protein